VADDRPNSFWCAGQNEGWFKLRFRAPIKVNTLRLREAIALGQRIEAVKVTTASGEVLAEFSSVGSCRIAQFPAVTVTELTFTFRGSAPPGVSEAGVFFDSGMKG
jgi:alpha-L-fucosidase